MKYTPEEVMQFVQEEDVKFIRLAFCNVYGKQHNVAIMPAELKRAFTYGIAFDASAVEGFGGEIRSDLLLHPDPSTLIQLPWRPEQGKVVRMFCDISYPDGRPFERDTRSILKRAVATAEAKGFRFAFGAEMEFYLFRQNEIDFRYSDPLAAADNAVTFHAMVRTVAAQNGLCASFSPKPLADCDGNGMHINVSVKCDGNTQPLPGVIAGILENIREMTLFLNPCEESYCRLGSDKAPLYVTWSAENRSQLIRIPAAVGEYRRAELRSADPMTNPYIAYTLLIYAGMYGLEHDLQLCPASDFNVYTAPAEVLDGLEKLPVSLPEAAALAETSAFIRQHLPEAVISAYCRP